MNFVVVIISALNFFFLYNRKEEKKNIRAILGIVHAIIFDLDF